ncbi:unnamed protein product, partial [marine sediment metagenome]
MRTLSLAVTKLAVTALVLTVLVFVPISSQAQTTYDIEGNNCTAINNLVIDGIDYDIKFVFDTGENLYGPEPYDFDFQSDVGNTEETSMVAAIAIREALNAAPMKILTVGPNKTGYFLLAATDENLDPDTDTTAVFSGWESRYDVQSDTHPRTPDTWAADDNWNFEIDLFPDGGGIIDIEGTPYPFGLNVWSRTVQYTYADAEFAGETSPADVSIGGSVTGLVGSGLVLQNNGMDDESIATDGP